MEISRQDCERLRLENERLATLNRDLQDQIAAKNNQILDVTAQRNTFSITLKNLFSHCQEICGQIASVYALATQAGRPPAAMPANELDFELPLTHLRELKGILATKPVLPKTRNLSVIPPLSRELSLESPRALGTSSVLEQTFVSPIGPSPLPLTKARSPPFLPRPLEAGHHRSQPVSGQTMPNKRIHGSQFKQ